MVRLSKFQFPLVFGGCLLVFAVGFRNWKQYFPEVEAIHRQRALETHQQALEFKQKVAEGIKKERERKAAMNSK